ncbi:MAG: hypothetical protein CVV25_12605, partial [Ignavibacteriae bacterium HGW-Ignavibacteriae-4]
MKTLIKILTILLFIPSLTYAQLEYHNWIFGDNVDFDPSENITGITFMTESGDPEYLNVKVSYYRDTSFYFLTKEGSASLSSQDGRLEYHTVDNGIVSFKLDTIVYDEDNTIVSMKEDTVIIEDSKLDGNLSGTQHVCIVRIGSKIIRIATSSHFDDINPDLNILKQDLTYVTIETERNEFKLSAKKNIKKAYGGESIAIIKDFESNSFYLIGNDRIEKQYYLFKYDIDSDSFIPKDTILSYMEPQMTEDGRTVLLGTIKVSQNGKFIVSTLRGSHNGIEVLKFNRELEKLELVKTFTDNEVIGDYLIKYSGDFSSNSEHFYLKGSKYFHVITNFSEIQNLRIKRVSEEIIGGDFGLQLAPNGKIYLVIANQNYLSSIENPNDINNFQYIEKSVSLHETQGKWGFPNIPTTYYFQVSTDIDSMEVCIGDEINIETETLNEPADAEYIWTNP